jgi:uncharacterized protein (TIGR00269 family)
MFEYNSRISLGVSGGKDSLSLLKILSEIEANRPHSELIAIFIDEGIKGHRDEALSLAKKNCECYDIELKVFSFKDIFNETMDSIAKKDRILSNCSYCGVLRRRALNKAAKEVKADILATGHNLDDMAQSTLLNVLRGNMSRMSTYDPGGNQYGDFVRRVKPLSEIPERETTLYAYFNDIEFQSIPCPYANEAMRTDVRNYLNRMEEKRPGTKFITYRTGLKIKQNMKNTRILKNCEMCGELTTSKHCRVCQFIEELQCSKKKKSNS